VGGAVVLALIAGGCSDKEAMDGTMIQNPKQIQDILDREPAKPERSSKKKP